MGIKWLAATVLWALSGAAAAVGQVADVTIFDRLDNRVLPIHRHEGRYYVVGTPGHEYRVRVRNRTGGEMLAVVSVDGVNAVTGETANWEQSGYVLGAHQGFDIMGWRKSLQRVAAFFFTRHANSYAARTGRPDNVGVIGVAVFRKKAEPAAGVTRDRRAGPRSPERAEGPAEPVGTHSDDSLAGAPAEQGAGGSAMRDQMAARAERKLGTGHGRSESSHVTYAEFERASAAPEEVIAIHYDTYRNLVAQGVIRGGQAGIPAPFPGQFVPDPR